MYKIFVINLGSSSTKMAYYEDDKPVLKANLQHPSQELKQFGTIWDQREYRLQAIVKYMEQAGIKKNELSAVVTRGGHCKPLVGGVYAISDTMIEQSKSGLYGLHATDLGLQLALALAGDNALALTVDPPVTDEFEPLARYSGLPGILRRSSFHALNHRAVGRQYALDIGRAYEEMNFVVIHMGGGISVAAHRKGRMIDANNGLMGDGPFSTNRTGGLPVGSLVELCFESGHSREEIECMLNGQGGMVAYVGESDALTVEKRAEAGDHLCSEVLDAMCYQTGKEVAACAAVLEGKVDAILITGGMANSERLTGFIKKMVDWIAPVHIYPGEYEMQSLALGAYRALSGTEQVKTID